MVHFFHQSAQTEEYLSLQQKIATEQLTAWYFLHDLLLERWVHFFDIFDEWTEQIQKINSELKKHREFLKVVFAQCEKEIRIRKSQGAIFQECPSCGFESDEHPADRDEPYDSGCWVCGLARRCLTIECPSCQTLVDFSAAGFADCGSCGQHLEPSDIAEALEKDATSAYFDPKEWIPPLTPAHCGTCGELHSVVETRGGVYFCSSCFDESDSVEFCEYCNEPNTNLTDGSYLSGCQGCDGKWSKILKDS